MNSVIKKTLSIVLCLIFAFGTFAVGGDGIAQLFETASIKAIAETYSTGDTIYYGTYPQSDVTDSLGSVLNAQGGTWKSYNYYSGSGSTTDGQMVAGDYMQYCDITYNSNKYRGVTFGTYRPYYTGYQTSTSAITYQDDNGYTYGNVYWFKYEPLKWRVLDASTGLVMCETIIDSQPYNNYIISNGTDGHDHTAYWGDSAQTYYANNYAKSSIRQWLNDDFYNTAFSDEQKSNIMTTTLNNNCWHSLNGYSDYKEYDAPSTSDKVFLLSWDDVTNSAYDFSLRGSDYDTARRLKGSDYAKCQGLYSGSEYDGNSLWWLRTPSGDSGYVRNVGNDGGAYSYKYVNFTDYGVCPAMCLSEMKSDSDGQDTPVDKEYTLKFTVDGNTVSEKKLKEGAAITKPADPVKDGYIFKGWTPDIPATMPASDLTFTAVFEKNTSTASAALKIPSNTEVEYAATVTVKAKATGVPKGYYVALYEGNNQLAKGSNTEVSCTFKGEFTGSKTITAKIIDNDGNVQKDGSGNYLSANFEVKAKSGFFAKLIAFFKRLFKSLPSVTVEPK